MSETVTPESNEPTSYKERLETGGEFGERYRKRLEAENTETPETAEEPKPELGLDGEPLATGDQLALYEKVLTSQQENPDTSLRERSGDWGLNFKQRYEMSQKDLGDLEQEAAHEIGRIEAKRAADERKAESEAREAEYQAGMEEIRANNDRYNEFYEMALKQLPEAELTASDSLGRHYEKQQNESERKKEAERIAKEMMERFKELAGEKPEEKESAATAESEEKEPSITAEEEPKEVATIESTASDILEELKRIEEKYANEPMPDEVREKLEVASRDVGNAEREFNELFEKTPESEPEEKETTVLPAVPAAEAEPVGTGEDEKSFRNRLRAVSNFLKMGRVPDALGILFEREDPDAIPGRRRFKRGVIWAAGAVAFAGAGFAMYKGLDWTVGPDETNTFDTSKKKPEMSSAGGGPLESGADLGDADFSESAQTTQRGEGWYQTINEATGVKKEAELRNILKDVGPDLVKMGEAYRDPSIGGYGISRPGHLSEEALNLIQKAAQKRGYTS